MTKNGLFLTDFAIKAEKEITDDLDGFFHKQILDTSGKKLEFPSKRLQALYYHVQGAFGCAVDLILMSRSHFKGRQYDKTALLSFIRSSAMLENFVCLLQSDIGLGQFKHCTRWPSKPQPSFIQWPGNRSVRCFGELGNSTLEAVYNFCVGVSAAICHFRPDNGVRVEPYTDRRLFTWFNDALSELKLLIKDIPCTHDRPRRMPWTESLIRQERRKLLMALDSEFRWAIQSHETLWKPVCGCLFQREGKKWRIAYNCADAIFNDLQGFEFIHKLLLNERKSISCLELHRPQGGSTDTLNKIRQTETPQAMIDEQAFKEYREKKNDLERELNIANASEDIARAESIEKEIEELDVCLISSTGLGGKPRSMKDSKRRARVSTLNQINYALEKIKPEIPALYKHFKSTIKTGGHCSYYPDSDISWTL